MYFCSNVTYFWIIYSIDFKFEILHFSLIKSLKLLPLIKPPFKLMILTYKFKTSNAMFYREKKEQTSSECQG